MNDLPIQHIRKLAKIAYKVDEPNGVTSWRPQDLPDPLFRVTLGDRDHPKNQFVCILCNRRG